MVLQAGASRALNHSRTAHLAVRAMASSPRLSKRVAVVGAGAAGLVAARELRREGHAVVVFEQAPRPGGVWLYDERVDTDVLGSDAARRRVHGSMYAGLRTNLPRELMSYSDFPLTPDALGPAYSADARRFCGHEEVLSYLLAFADHYGVGELVRYGTRVECATPLFTDGGAAGGGPRWRVDTAPSGELDGGADTTPSSSSSSSSSEVFDALLVCNGHYSEPNLPDVPGAASFPGLIMHSHNYRRPLDSFKNAHVLVVGASNSGDDVAREVADVAERVYLCGRTWREPGMAADATPFGRRGNIERRGMVAALRRDGGAEFEVGASVGGGGGDDDAPPPLDAVIYATGYRHHFPFLDLGALGLSAADQRVAPLFQHMFAPSTGASLAFIGLPWKVVPFPLCELQAKLVSRLLSGRAAAAVAATLADGDAMREWAASEDAKRAAEGVPARYAHMMNHSQWEYMAWIADACGGDVPRLPAWRAAMYSAIGRTKAELPEEYRDMFSDAEAAAEARAEFDALLAADAAAAGGVPLAQRLAERRRVGAAATAAAL